MPIQLDSLQTDVHLDRLNILLDGAQASEEVMRDLLDCTVENSLHLPDLCSMRFYLDDHFTWMENNMFALGKTVKILAGSESEALRPLFWGEITALEMDLAASGVPTILVRCLDKSHRLHRGRFQRTFVNVKDSDIVSQIASECGLTADTTPTAQVHDWVCQNNQTNWEFLCDRAARNGYRLYLFEEKTLRFKPADTNGTANVTTRWGTDLRSFRPRLSAAPQVSEVIVRGWDPKTKKTIIGRAKKAEGIPRIGDASSKNPSQAATKAFSGARPMVIVDRPVTTQDEANILAHSLCDEIGQNYIEADGICLGSPLIHAGENLRIEEVGARFTGDYFVTAVTHLYTPAEGYTTTFAISGKRANTVLSLLGAGATGGISGGGNDGRTHPQGGNIAIALVTDIKDPEGLGRVKVKYPHLSEEHASFWARQATPMTGNGRGFLFLPEINDEVLVAFEHGDIHRPYIIGSLWNGMDKPHELSNDGKVIVDGKVQRRTIKTRIGHTMAFDDTDGKGEISLTTKAKNLVRLDDKEENITVLTTKNHKLILDDKNQHVTVTTTKNHKLILDDKNQNITAITTGKRRILLDDKNSKIIVEDSAGNRITINSSDNSMKLESLQNFTVEAGGKVSITGKQGVTVSTPMQMKVEGQMGVDVSTGMAMNLKAGLAMQVQGTTTSVKGSAMVEVAAPAIKIG